MEYINNITKILIKKTYFITVIMACIICLICSTAIAGQQIKGIKEGKDVSATGKKDTNPLLYSVKFFQKHISRIDGDRCSMYPSCSQYCINALKKHGYFLGWIMSCDRLMRCGRDEVKLSAPIHVNNKKLTYDPVSNNDFWW